MTRLHAACGTAAPRNKQAGFTLLELLLSIGLLALLLVGIYQLFDSWSQRAVNRVAATDMLRVQAAAQDYVLANFETFKTEPVGQFIELDINDLKTFNYLPTGYQPRNAFKQSIRVFYRNNRVQRLNKDGTLVYLDDGVTPVYINTIEVTTVSDNPSGATIRVPNKRLMDTARAGGPKMGIISEAVVPGASYSGRVSSLFADWYYDRANLGSVGYTATPDTQGGYLAAYGLVNAEATDANDEWLYRVIVDGRPELNRMKTDLHMNGYPIENVGTLVADKINVTGNATFRGTTQGTAGAESANAMTIEQALRLDSAGESRINMKAAQGTSCTFTNVGGGNRTVSPGCSIVGGELQVISQNSDATMNLTVLNTYGSIITDYANVGRNAAGVDMGGTTTARGINTFTNATGTNMNATDQVVAPTFTVTGANIQTQQLQATNFNVSAGANVTNQLIAASVRPTDGYSLNASTMDIGNAVQLNQNIITNTVTATRTLYSNSATGSYWDTVVRRSEVCRPYNGRVYCEPEGDAYWPIGCSPGPGTPGSCSFLERCSFNGANGYQCWHWRVVDGAWNYYGYCNHVRSTGASGQAYWIHSCGSA